MGFMRSIGVKLRMDTGEYRRDAQQAKKDTKDLGDEGKRTKASMEGMASGMAIAGTAIVAAFAVAEFAAGKFDKQMSEVGAVANATAGELGALRDAAIQAGAETSFSASQAAEAEAELAKAGVSAAEILGGGLSGALSLAAAGSLDLATAATIASAAMNTFGLKGDDVGHIADVLAAAANKSAASVEDLGLGMQQVGLVAAQVGFSLEETVGILAAFADRGLRGSDGATSLKTALLRLAAPLPEASAKMQQLGISLYDTNGNMVDAVTIAGQLEKGLGDLSSSERNAALQTIFGSDAIRAANVLYGEGAAGIRDYIRAVNDQGAASDVAKKKLDNLAGDVEALGGSFETLFISASQGTTGPLRELTTGLTDLINIAAGLPGPLQATILGVVGLTGVALLGTGVYLKASAALGAMNTQLIAMGATGKVAAGGLRFATAAAGGLVLALTAAAVAYEIFQKATGHDDQIQRLLTPKAVNDLAARFHIVGETLTDTADLVDRELTRMVESGQAGAAMSMIQAAAANAGKSVEELMLQFPNFAAAQEKAFAGTEQQSAAAINATNANIELAGAFGKAASEAGGLKAAFDALNGVEIGWIDAQINAEAAVDDLRDALKASNGSLDVHEEKGRAALAAVTDLAVKAAEAAQAKYDETASVEEANKVYQEYVDQLRLVLQQAGVAQEEIDRLVGSITKMPEFKAVTIDVRANVKVNSNGRLGIPIANVPIFMRQGGIVHAAQGRLDPAIVTSPSVVFGERGTGGEAFIPRNGDDARALGIADQAARWHGGMVVPRGSMWGGATTVNVRVGLAPGADGPLGRAIEDHLRVSTTQTTDSVQNNYGRRGRV